MIVSEISMLPSAISILAGSYSVISQLITSYGYYAIFVLMLLESASIPIPSEVILPLIGYFSFKGLLDPYAALLVALAAGLIGFMVDYYIAYLFEKDVVYRHLGAFHIKEKDVKAFDSWFERNGSFAVFISRMLPVVRGLINFPAGFARMPKKKFIVYSMAGSFIWDVALMAFGFYGITSSSIYSVIAYVAVVCVILYAIYRISMKKIRNPG